VTGTRSREVSFICLVRFTIAVYTKPKMHVHHELYLSTVCGKLIILYIDVVWYLWLNIIRIARKNSRNQSWNSRHVRYCFDAECRYFENWDIKFECNYKSPNSKNISEQSAFTSTTIFSLVFRNKVIVRDYLYNKSAFPFRRGCFNVNNFRQPSFWPETLRHWPFQHDDVSAIV